MSWEKVDLEKWASEMGVSLYEIDQKLKLRNRIIKLRKQLDMTQEELAQQVGISRSRIAQIENGVKLHKMSFDILFKVLHALGYEYIISARKQAA